MNATQPRSGGIVDPGTVRELADGVVGGGAEARRDHALGVDLGGEPLPEICDAGGALASACRHHSDVLEALTLQARAQIVAHACGIGRGQQVGTVEHDDLPRDAR